MKQDVDRLVLVSRYGKYRLSAILDVLECGPARDMVIRMIKIVEASRRKEKN
jgi:hypothetical protein